jgi:RNA polymerase sigma-70 factor (ECF subfamily)
MNDPQSPAVLTEARAQFDELVRTLRPELHRYCARMTGSVIDGEDVAQDTLAKAFFQLSSLSAIPDLRPWLFRIAHNKSIDFLRRSEHRHVELPDELPQPALETEPLEQAEIAASALSWYLKLTALQRSCVILMDILGYSMAELCEILDLSLPAIKGALHRGRVALRQSATATRAITRAPLDADEERQLTVYVRHFNNRNFDALRELLASDARLELVGRTSSLGATAVGKYFGNYARLDGWRVECGTVDGRAAILGFDHEGAQSDAMAGRPTFFMLIEWRAGKIQSIRDYRYARYTTDLAQL